MNFKFLFSMILVLCLLAACQQENSDSILSKGESISEVFIYKSETLKNTEDDLVAELNTKEASFFENILKEAERNTEKVESDPSNYDIEFKRKSGTLDEVDLKLGNTGEESILLYGKDSKTETISYIVSPEQTTELKEIILN